MKSQGPNFNLAPSSESLESLRKENTEECVVSLGTGRQWVKVDGAVLREKSTVLAEEYEKGKRSIKLGDFDFSTVQSIAAFLEKESYNLPAYVTGITELQAPSAAVQRTNVLHRVNVVGQADVSSATSLRRNKGNVNLAGLVAHQKPNLQGHVNVYKAAKVYRIQGLSQFAETAFHELASMFKGHPDLKRIVDSGLPFPFQPRP